MTNLPIARMKCAALKPPLLLSVSPWTDFWNKVFFFCFFFWLIWMWKMLISFCVCFSCLRVMRQTFVSKLNLGNGACDAGSCPPSLPASPALADSRREVWRTLSRSVSRADVWRQTTPVTYSIRSQTWMTLDRERMPTQSRWESTTHSQNPPAGRQTHNHSAARQQC